jgi:hypothetical protein
MRRPHRIPEALILSAVLLAVLVGCSEAEDPSNLHHRCDGADKVFILDDPNKGSDLFIIPNHPDCAGGAS